MEEFSVAIRRILAKRDISPSRLADTLEVSQESIGEFLQGDSTLSLRHLNALSSALELSSEEKIELMRAAYVRPHQAQTTRSGLMSKLSGLRQRFRPRRTA